MKATKGLIEQLYHIMLLSNLVFFHNKKYTIPKGRIKKVIRQVNHMIVEAPKNLL